MIILQSLLAETRLCNVVQSQFRSEGVFTLARTVSIQQSPPASKPLMAISRSLQAAVPKRTPSAKILIPFPTPSSDYSW